MSSAAEDAAPLLSAKEKEGRLSLNVADGATEASAHEHNRAAYLIVILQGFGLLLSWNVILNAVSYFQHEYPENSDGISFYMTAAYMYPQVPLLLLMVHFGNRFSFNSRILTCLVLQTASMALLPVLAHTSMWTTLSIAFTLGVTTAILQSSLFGLISMFPRVYAQGMMSGQGLAGITASVAAVVVKASISSATDASQQTAATIYFVFSAATLLACIGSYIYLMRMPFTHYYLKRSGSTAPGGEGGKLKVSAGDEEAPHTALLAAAAVLQEDGKAVASTSTATEPPSTDRRVLITVAVPGIAVFVVFFITFVVFPSVAPFSIAFKGSLGAISLSDSWWSTILLLIFNIFDTIGRTLPAWYAALKGKKLLAAACARAAIAVLFLGCARDWSPGLNDVVALLAMMAFAFTNGYFSSLSMMSGPQSVGVQDREKAGLIMTLLLQLGILIGSQASFAFKPPQT